MIPNGVDLERFSPLPLPPHPVVVVIANLIAYKRHDLFLHAIELVGRSISGARAVLVGEGPERSRLEKLAAELGIAERVEFRGEVADVRAHLADARVVALTSEHEGTPNALLEAMAMGRPVVATPVGGIPDLVRDGVDGCLAEPTPAALSEAIGALLTDDDLAEQHGGSGARTSRRVRLGSCRRPDGRRVSARAQRRPVSTGKDGRLMCGIAGRLAVDGANASESAVIRSLEVMRHRGPDDLVTWS